MASPRKRNNMWEARIQWRDSDGRKKEKPYSLNTSDEAVADVRMVYINKYEPALKRSEEISFPWDNDEGKIQIVHYNLKTAKLDWEKSFIDNRMATGSIEIYLVCKKLGHSSVTTTEIYTKFEESELRKHFPIEACRLVGVGQIMKDSQATNYNYGKA